MLDLVILYESTLIHFLTENQWLEWNLAVKESLTGKK